MAYYTIAHLLQGRDNLDGHNPSPLGITTDQLNDAVFDYIFLQAPYPEGCSVPEEKLQQLRREFEYWYPMDLRVSAKDLIPNHLTMCLYNHVEIWADRPEMWPRSIYTNGHIMVDKEKMSKSKGNFYMMLECVEKFSADATRFALADAGDTMEDANFAIDQANNAVQSLYIEEEWIRSILEADPSTFRDGPESEYLYMDRVFMNEMDDLIARTDANFSNIFFREGLKTGWFDFQIVRDHYRDWSVRCGIPMHRAVIMRFIEAQALLISPICPHWAEHVWGLLGKPGSITHASWPAHSEPDKRMLKSSAFFREVLKTLRAAIGKAKAGYVQLELSTSLSLISRIVAHEMVLCYLWLTAPTSTRTCTSRTCTMLGRSRCSSTCRPSSTPGAAASSRP